MLRHEHRSIGFMFQNYYRWTSREIKRISSIALSPVYANFNETISGLSTIRAFRHALRFVEHNYSLVSNSLRAQFTSTVASSWLNFRLQLIAIVMVASISLIGVFQHVYSTSGVNPSLVGLSLSYILSVTGLLNGLISTFTETEKEMVGIERVSAYIEDLPRENERQENSIDFVIDSTNQGAEIEYQHVTLRYNDSQQPALENLSFRIRSNEKIGIVGRTGLLGIQTNFFDDCSPFFSLNSIKHGQVLAKVVYYRHFSEQFVFPTDEFFSTALILEESIELLFGTQEN